MKARTFTHVGTSLLLSLIAMGCAAREDGEDALADESSAMSVSVCRTGESLPLVWTDAFYSEHRAKYDAENGTVATIDDYAFNPSEFGYFVMAYNEESDMWHYVSSTTVEACSGTLRVLPKAKVEHAGDERLCEPGSVSGSTCDLKDGTELYFATSFIEQRFGFVSVVEDLDLREAPTTNSRILGAVPRGKVLELTGEREGEYQSVAYGGTHGWGHIGHTGTFVGTAVTTHRLNLRAYESVLAPIQMVIPAGARVVLTGSGMGQFVTARYGDRTGVVSGRFLKDPVDDASLGE